jgi:hypothetical protein
MVLNSKLDFSIMDKLMCFIFGHRYRLKQNINSYIREVKCERCQKEWGMNDEVRQLLPLDDELKEQHREMKVGDYIE